MPAPTAEEQVEFLRKLQALLDGGQFVASYKFALLRAIADLAVARGDDSGDELTLQVPDIGEAFVELYWRQARPYPAAGPDQPAPLRQNTGQQAAVIRHLAEAHTRAGGSLSALKQRRDEWNSLVAVVSDVVAKMPLWKLQRVGDAVVDFMYPNVETGHSITLRPGIAYCFRAFYGMIRQLVEGAWLNYVRGLNRNLLGESADVETFLFGSDRASLDVYLPLLRDLQSGRCFYCAGPVSERGDVDHFIPWSRYPIDLGHNFVLSHGACNRQKQDHIAHERHLEAWALRNDHHDAAMRQFFDSVYVPYDKRRSHRVARWAYESVALNGSLVWTEAQVLVPLGDEWRRILQTA